MPSDKEIRVWIIGIIVGAWLLLAWIIADQCLWAPQGTPEEMLREITRRLQIHQYVGTAGMAAGVLLMTRVLYGLLRGLREMQGGPTHRS